MSCALQQNVRAIIKCHEGGISHEEIRDIGIYRLRIE
jgi:hypothetical protein